MDRTSVSVTVTGALVRLNPYSNGIWIEQIVRVRFTWPQLCLNPYSNGIWREQDSGK